MDIGLVGPGRLGRSLAQLWAEAGHRVDLRGRGEAPPSGEVVVLAVPDRAIPEVAAALPVGPVVLHCSGASDVDVLDPHVRRGSLHPLMTFPGLDVGLPAPGAPAAVAGHPDAVEAAACLARDAGLVPFEVPGDRRLYHAAAVTAGNFATVLLLQAAEILAAAGVPADQAPALLAPLAIQSIRNAALDPSRALTGPAVRGDLAVIEGHREAMRASGLHDRLEVYDLLTRGAVALAGRGFVSARPLTKPEADEG